MKKLLTTTLLACLTLHALPGWAQDSEDKKADLRLALDKVALYADTNKLDKAFALVNQLKAEYPDNSQVLQAEADLNLRIGNRGAGFAELNKAVTLDPANEDVLERQRQAVLVQGPFVEGGYRWRQTQEANEHFGRIDGQGTLSATSSASITLENDHLTSRVPIIRENGTSRSYSGDRQRGTITLGKVFTNGDQGALMLHANDNTVGAGGQYSLWDHYGATTLQANFNKPDWNYIEMVIQDGTRDNVRLERKQIITNHLQATLGGGYNRYSLDHIDDVADAPAWDLNVAYTTPITYGRNYDNVMLGLYYSVEAEYFTHVDTRLAGGTTYKPLPTSSYEIHSANLSLSKNFSSQVYGEAFGGYGIDRLGDQGPLFGAALEYAPVEHLGIELRGSRTLQGGIDNSGKETQIGLNVKWRW